MGTLPTSHMTTERKKPRLTRTRWMLGFHLRCRSECVAPLQTPPRPASNSNTYVWSLVKSAGELHHRYIGIYLHLNVVGRFDSCAKASTEA